MADNELDMDIEAQPEIDLQATGLIVPSGDRRDEIALLMQSQAESARAWIEYIANRVEAHDSDEAQRGLIQVHAILEEISQQADLTSRVLGGMQELVETIAAARDEAEKQVADLEEQIEDIQEEVYLEAEQMFYENLDVNEIHSSVEADRDESIQWTIAELRRLGDMARADELKHKHMTARQQRSEVEDILSRAESERWARQRGERARQREAYAAGQMDEDDDLPDEDDEDGETV